MSADRLLGLLPAHVRTRDERSGGLLRALLDAVAGELDVLERDLAELYDDWFVETAQPEVLPRLADLLGVDDLPSGPGRRALVANTVALRRRKGTPAAVEQLARDVSGWPTRVVEWQHLLVVSAHVNHVRLDRPATADVRRSGDLGPGTARGSLDPAPHTAEVRRAASGRGRYGIGRLGVFCFPGLVSAVDRAPAVATPDGWSLHPLGVPTPLFALPAAEPSVEHRAGEGDLPLPLRPRRLLALLAQARAGRLQPDDLPLAVDVDAQDLDGPTLLGPERVRVCGLEDLVPGLPGWQVLVDPVLGRLHTYRDGVLVEADDDPATREVAVHCRWAYGATADVGAGTHDRTAVHEQALTSDGYVRAVDPEVVAQVEVRLDSPPPGGAGPVGRSLPDALATVAAQWAADPATTGSTTVVSVGDSGSWTGDVAVELPPSTRLVLVAAAWPARLLASGEVLPPVPGEYAAAGLRPHLRGTLTVSGGPGSALVLDGLVLEGDLVVRAGRLAALTVCSATVTGAVRVTAGPVQRNGDLRLRLVRSAVGAVDCPAPVPEVEVVDAVLSAEVGGAPVASSALHAPAAHLRLEGSTVRGGVTVRTLSASGAVLDGRVLVAHRQTGCVRSSYLGPGSRTPRRSRCVPDRDGTAAPAPTYASLDAGSPWLLALARSCPPAIRTGGEDGTEMGVHGHLQRPGRLAAVARLVPGFLPAAQEAGVFSDG